MAAAAGTRWRLALSPWLGLVAGCMAVGLLRWALSAGSGASLHVDEAQYWDWSRQLQWGYHSKPPVIAALIAASTALFGDSEAGLRALAIACYPLTALVLGLLARDIARDGAGPPREAAAGWAAAIFLASPLAALLGLVATTDAPLLLCWSAALAGLWAATRRQRAWGWALFALATGIGLLSKYTLAALLAGAWLFVLLHRRRQLPALALATAAALLLLLPHLLWNAQAGWPTLRHTAEITVGTEGRPGGGWWALAGFVAAQALVLAPLALPVWMLHRWRARAVTAPPGPAWPFLWLTTGPLLLAGLAQAWRSGAQLNWIAPAHLAATLAWALCLTRSPAGLQRRIALWLLVQALLLAGLTLAPRLASASGRSLPPALDLWARMRGWDRAFERLAATLPARDGVLVVGTSRTVMAQAAYHWRDLGIARHSWRAGAQPGHHYERACPFDAAAARPERLLVLSDGPLWADLQDRLGPLQLLQQQPVTRTPTRRIELRLWQAQAPAGASAAPPLQPPCR